MIEAFLKDHKYPIQPIEDPGYLSYTLDFFHAQEEYDAFLSALRKDFDGSTDKWSAYVKGVREDMIRDVKASPEYQSFITVDMSKYAIPAEVLSVGGKGVYNPGMVGEVYLSIDLKAANFQVFRYLGIHKEETWEEVIGGYTSSPILQKSKQFRSGFYGNLNPARTMTIEKYLMSQIHNLLGIPGLVSIVNDELIYKTTTILDPELIKKELGLEVKVSSFKLHGHALQGLRGRLIRFYEKEDLITGEKTYHCLPSQYYLLAMKLLRGEKPCEYDIWFLSDGVRCKIMEDFILL